MASVKAQLWFPVGHSNRSAVRLLLFIVDQRLPGGLGSCHRTFGLAKLAAVFDACYW